MDDAPEGVARVGLAGWVGESVSDDPWETAPVLGTLGELYLVEIDASNRERVLAELIDRHEVDDRSLRIEIVLFGDAGGFFATAMHCLELWPSSSADMPSEVFVDDHYKAAFTHAGDEIVMSVRHARRPGGGPPTRRFRFRPDEYREAISELARESRRLRDDLIALAQRRAPEKVESLRDALSTGPASLRLH
jgi:hypothetical protein